MTHSEALISLNKVGNIGSVRLKKLLAYFSKPQDIFKAPYEKIASILGGNGETARAIASFKEEEVRQELDS
ncbi:MAG TPA: hypothetical protein VMD04_03465, partial [Candidatus Margulisiibacteriota bacterium]|nr:hypothetical protein [Candidatus Margulisiibacteriota bacterium]